MKSEAIVFSEGVAGMLRTREDFRNRGLASFLLKKTAEKMLDLGLVPCVHIEEDNLVSQTFFYKNGFVRSEVAQWVTHKTAVDKHRGSVETGNCK